MNAKLNTIFFLVLTALVNAQCQTQDPQTTISTDSVPGIVLSNMDTTVSPDEDFYRYVNGGWMAANEIPADRTEWDAFAVLRKKTDNDVLAIIQATQPKDYPSDSDQRKALLLFISVMDTIARNEASTKPLQPTLDKLASVENWQELQTLLATNMIIPNPFFRFGGSPDFNNSAMNSAHVVPGLLQLPRDYYVNQDEKSQQIRAQYLDHITRMLQFIGDTKEEARQSAETILALEIKLAQPRLNKVELRDTRKLNNPRSLTQLGEMTPVVNWNKLITDVGVNKPLDTVIVGQPEYMRALQAILTETPLKDLKSLVRWATLDDAAEYLSMPLVKADWEFYSQTLRGAQAQRPLAEQALSKTNDMMGEAIGQLYVAEKFPPEAKADAKRMIDNIIKAFEKRITVLDWMSDSTKAQAIDKLRSLTVKIGYPDQWEDYAGIAIDENNTYFENVAAVSEWQYQENIKEIGEPVDKSEWSMPPQAVNAYYNPQRGEIAFPAGILQPPFFNYTADAAVNYGGIGAVIGHEISHAFDDQGARFDKYGNLANWWTESDLEKFTQRGEGLIKQYDAIEVLDSVYVNGAFTLGENIGDMGGVLAAYDGLQMHLAEHGRPDTIDGLTPEQRFFISWATVWQTKVRENELRDRIKTDPHSPGKVRAVQPLLNVAAFYEAFGIQPGDSLYLAPEERVQIW